MDKGTLVMTNLHLPTSFTFSQSSLQDYHDCEKRFYLRYIKRLAWPSIEVEPILENEQRQIEGQKFHKLVHQYLLGIPINKLNKQAATYPLSQWWQNYLSSDLELDENVLLPEIPLITNLGNHTITAKYDLIAIHNDKIRIFDWKTYHKRPSESTMRLRYQTRVYCSLLVKTAPTLIKKQAFDPDKLEMIYWLANFPAQPIKLIYTETQYDKDWQHLENVITRIAKQDEFNTTKDEKKCRFCFYRSYCDRGGIAGNWNDDIEISLDLPELSLEEIEEIEF